jgi:hypothetical protein
MLIRGSCKKIEVYSFILQPIIYKLGFGVWGLRFKVWGLEVWVLG